MGTALPSRRRDRRRIVCRSDGSMFDINARHRVTAEELRDHLQDGGLFEATTEATGRDCTLEVLRKLMLPAGMDALTAPGGAGGGLPGLGSLGGMSQLGLIAGLFTDQPWRDTDRDRADDRVRTRSRRRREGTDDFRAEFDTEPEPLPIDPGQPQQ